MVNRRIGKENSETRLQLLDAAEKMMREEGYAEVTSRKLARYADLKPALVHYYFRTMDELFEALFKHVCDSYLATLMDAADQSNPIARLFELSCDSTNAVLHLEFIALANHRKNLHGLIRDFGIELNRIKADVIRRCVSPAELQALNVTPETLSTILETVARGISFTGGFNAGQAGAAKQVLISWLENFDQLIPRIIALGKSQPQETQKY